MRRGNKGKYFLHHNKTSKTGDPENFNKYVIMDLQLIEADSGELRKQMDKYKLYVVYYSYFIIQPDMLMSKHAILIFLNKEDQ